MSTRTTPWPSGVPCWVELTSPDVDAAKAFYSAVCGWDYDEAGPEFGGYVTAQVDGQAAAGITPRQEGAPVAWTPYLASDDVDATARAVTDNGGTLVVPPGDVGDLGRMCLATEPGGGVFGVWQHGAMIGAGSTNAPGGLTWEDLRSSDPDAARSFFGAVFGYHFDAIPDAPGDYTTFALAGQEAPLGGVGGLGDESGPGWAIYFGVTDADAAVAAATASGGSVRSEPFDTPYGRMAGLTDPGGAPVWVVEMPPEGTPASQG
jgi:uncharacterized protein